VSDREVAAINFVIIVIVQTIYYIHNMSILSDIESKIDKIHPANWDKEKGDE
jgi:hypothetical protein